MSVLLILFFLLESQFDDNKTITWIIASLYPTLVSFCIWFVTQFGPEAGQTHSFLASEKILNFLPEIGLSIRTTLRVVLHFSIPPTLLTTATLSNQNKDAEVALNERVFHRRLRREMKEFRGASESDVKGDDETR